MKFYKTLFAFATFMWVSLNAHVDFDSDVQLFFNNAFLKYKAQGAELLKKYDEAQAHKKILEIISQNCIKSHDIADCSLAVVTYDRQKEIQKAKEPLKILMDGLKHKCDTENNATLCHLFAGAIDDFKSSEIMQSFKHLKEQYIAKACDLDDQSACYEILYAIKDDYDRLNKADEYCHRGLFRFCLSLGYCYAAPKGERVNLRVCTLTQEKPFPQSKKAIEYLKKYYELNPSEPPSALGEELIFDGQCKDGLKILRDYCDKKDDQSCFLLGYAYLSGQCVRYNTKEAKRLFGLSGEYGFQGGCTEYKRMSK